MFQDPEFTITYASSKFPACLAKLPVKKKTGKIYFLQTLNAGGNA